MSGAGPDTAAWIQRQLSTAQVGYEHTDNHNGASYDVRFSQYGTDTINYAIYVRPARRRSPAMPVRTVPRRGDRWEPET